MKSSVPSIAYLSCMIAPCMVNSFTSTSLRTSSQPQIIQPTSPRLSPPNQPDSSCSSTPTSTSLFGYHSNQYSNGRSSSRYASQQDRTKRQERVGHVVRSELATVLSRDTSLKNDNEPIEFPLRRRINIVHTDVSPDLRQARVTVSIMGKGGASTDRKDDVIAKRRAYAWLVRNTKNIRYALAQRMGHMKGGSPDLTFVQVDVGAAVDVMQLIEKVSKGYKREDVDVLGMGFYDEDDEDGDWEDEEEGDEDDDGWSDFDEDEDGISVEVEV